MKFKILLSLVFGMFFITIQSHAAIIVVTTPNNAPEDDGFCGLHEAITNANKNDDYYLDCPAGEQGPGVVDEIHFDISEGYFGPGPYEIVGPESAKINIKDSLLIDGETQEGAYCDNGAAQNFRQLMIAIKDYELGINNFGVVNHVSNVTIRGLAVYGDQHGFGSGIVGRDFDTVVIECNNIGTDFTGHTAIPNRYGIAFHPGTSNLRIGGPTRSQMNVVSGNDRNGIWIHGPDLTVIQGNHIGVDLEGDDPLPNGWNGIQVDKSFNSIIGGLSSEEANIIANNAQDGVKLNGLFDNWHILGNKIYNNGELGIDINTGGGEGACGFSPNDEEDLDLVQYLNFPEIQSVHVDPNIDEILIELELDVRSDTTTRYRLEFFSNPSGSDSCSNHGEGEVLIGSVDVADDVVGPKTHLVTLPIPLGMDPLSIVNISSTTTEIFGPMGVLPFGSTSEFSEIFTDVVMEEFKERDYGDAPDVEEGTAHVNYETTYADNGASHELVEGAPYLGECVDGDDGTQQNIFATADDIAVGDPVFGSCSGQDDEDGVFLPQTFIVPGQFYFYTVNVTGGGYVHGWIDWNSDGDWTDPGEKILNNFYADTNIFASFFVPFIQGLHNQTYARFRITSYPSPDLLPTGFASDGEVEDYLIQMTGSLTGGGTTEKIDKWSPKRK